MNLCVTCRAQYLQIGNDCVLSVSVLVVHLQCAGIERRAAQLTPGAVVLQGFLAVGRNTCFVSPPPQDLARQRRLGTRLARRLLGRATGAEPETTEEATGQRRLGTRLARRLLGRARGARPTRVGYASMLTHHYPQIRESGIFKKPACLMLPEGWRSHNYTT